eukprot:GHVT01033075.1.p2 GENE.GHVT01033075.1~~GHVT01033075.1.p2  ORF type:complete len:166 (+),score=20.87 GHVT01033075.1:1180-1677(+)
MAVFEGEASAYRRRRALPPAWGAPQTLRGVPFFAAFAFLLLAALAPRAQAETEEASIVIPPPSEDAKDETDERSAQRSGFIQGPTTTSTAAPLVPTVATNPWEDSLAKFDVSRAHGASQMKPQSKPCGKMPRPKGPGHEAEGLWAVDHRQKGEPLSFRGSVEGFA